MSSPPTMQDVRNLQHRFRGHLQLQPDTGSAFLLLEQPLDIIAHMMKTMRGSERLMLAQTCSALCRMSLQIPACLSHQRHEAGKPLKNLMTPTERVDCLCITIRDRLDIWVCGRCAAVHPVDNLNGATVSMLKWQTACPKALKGSHFRLSREICTNRSNVALSHDQVQIVLKMVRQWATTPPKHRNYVRAVMAPDSATRRTCHRRLPPLEPVIYDYWTQSKVIKSTRTCSHQYGRDIRPLTVPYLRACVHCLFEPVAYIMRYDKTMRDYQPMCEMVRRAWGRGDGKPTFGACSMCATDFAIHFTLGSPRKAILHTWHDLGDGSSMIPWRAMHEMPFHIAGRPRKGPRATQHHEPGSVMRMYEKGQSMVDTVSPPGICKMDMLRFADRRPVHVADPLDGKMLSDEHKIYRLPSDYYEEKEIFWSIHDLDKALEEPTAS